MASETRAQILPPTLFFFVLVYHFLLDNVPVLMENADLLAAEWTAWTADDYPVPSTIETTARGVR